MGYPPNCKLSIEWAVKYGAKAVEYDIVCCKDGDKNILAVIEPKLLKENRLDINNLKWEDVRKINAGNDKYGECPVATFEEVQRIIPSDVYQQIHIKKGENFDIIPELISKIGEVSVYTITTFDINVIKMVKKAKADALVGWIVKPEQGDGDEGTTDLTALVSSNPDALPDYKDEEINGILVKAKEHGVSTVILCGPRVRDKKIIDKVKKAGFKSGSWGVGQNLEVAKRLISYEIDMFTIDNPEAL